jgi:hypothetical protein
VTLLPRLGETERGGRTEVSAVTNASDTELAFDAESDKVTAWRACELLKAGYEPLMAVELAEHPGVDLHVALELVERGCQPDLAARILL